MPSLPKSPSLAEVQRLMAQAVMRPLTGTDRMQRRWEEGGRTNEVAESFIKPNDKLNAFDRLEIYNRQYWFRLLDCLHEDFPGLRAILGSTRFHRLATEYLVKYPSASPTLRDLGGRLARFLAEEPGWTAPHSALAHDMARLEWAQIVAFDGPKRRALTLRHLGSLPPERIFLRLQPFITLLDLQFPVDRILLRLLQQEERQRGETSNASDTPARPPARSIARKIPAEPTRLLVHRQENAVYFKRLSEPEFALLQALHLGSSLSVALEKMTGSVRPQNIQEWFQNWAALGFLTPAA